MNFRGKKDPVLRASPGRSAEVIGSCPELGGWHSIAAHSSGLYVAGQYGLFHSRDKGGSWKPVRTDAEETWAARGLATMPDGTIWIGFEDKMASSTDGKTWKIVKLPSGAKGGRPSPIGSRRRARTRNLTPSS